MKILWLFTGVLALGLSEAARAADPIGTVETICKQGGRAGTLLADLGTATDTLFEKPTLIHRYIEGGKSSGFSGYKAGLIDNLKDRQLCATGFKSSVSSAYNAGGVTERKNFWIIAGACLAGHEGAEAWELGTKMNALDTCPNAKYVYGAFQLSAENGGGVEDACIPAWNASHAIKQPVDLGAGKGVKKTEEALRLMGLAGNQTFNIFCGMHEMLRAAAVPGKACLNIFNDNQNRFGPLRRSEKAFKDCVNKYAVSSMSAKTTEQIRLNIATYETRGSEDEGTGKATKTAKATHSSSKKKKSAK